MKRFEVYKKNDVLVEVLDGTEDLGLELLEEQSTDSSVEKHVPFVEIKEDGYFVRVGENTLHPMTEAHYIQYIELIVDEEYVYRKFLKPGDQPEAYFKVPVGRSYVAREYCNLHGLWKS